VHAVIVKVQNTAMQAEESGRYTSPANCWLLTPVPQEVMIGNLHLVAKTAAVAIASAAACAAAACAAAACAAAAVAAAACAAAAAAVAAAVRIT